MNDRLQALQIYLGGATSGASLVLIVGQVTDDRPVPLFLGILIVAAILGAATALEAIEEE